MKYQKNGKTIELVKGDIARQENIEAVVNAANAELQIGGGVAGALHRAAGSGLAEECAPLAPIAPGEAVLTGAHQLPNKYVIHCLGPVYGRDRPSDDILKQCYSHAMGICRSENIKSVAFPAISTGAFGFPLKKAAEIAMNTVLNELEKVNDPQLVRFVLFSKQDFEAFQQQLPGKKD